MQLLPLELGEGMYKSLAERSDRKKVQNCEKLRIRHETDLKKSTFWRSCAVLSAVEREERVSAFVSRFLYLPSPTLSRMAPTPGKAPKRHQKRERTAKRTYGSSIPVKQRRLSSVSTIPDSAGRKQTT